jgi:DNA polymerase-3 subunit delta'
LLQQRAERLDKLLDVLSADNEARFAYAAQLAAQFGQNRKSVHDVLDLWIDWWRDLLLVKAGCADAITDADHEDMLIEQAGAYSLAEIRTVIDGLQAAGEQLRQNANPRLVLEVFMLTIPRKEVRGEGDLTARFSVKYG